MPHTDYPHALPIHGDLHRYGAWITDGAFFAHAALPLFGQLHKWLPNRDGIYHLTGRLPNPTYTRRALLPVKVADIFNALTTAPAFPTRFTAQPTPGQDLAYWTVETPGREAVWQHFDARLAWPVTQPTEDAEPVDDWAITRLGGLFVLVGLTGQERRFYLMSHRAQ